MKISEMNVNQKRVLLLVREVASEFIGGNFCALQDYNPRDNEYKEAYTFLSDRKVIIETITTHSLQNRELAIQLKFAGNDFLHKVVSYWVKQMYDTDLELQDMLA